MASGFQLCNCSYVESIALPARRANQNWPTVDDRCHCYSDSAYVAGASQAERATSHNSLYGTASLLADSGNMGGAFHPTPSHTRCGCNVRHQYDLDYWNATLSSQQVLGLAKSDWSYLQVGNG